MDLMESRHKASLRSSALILRSDLKRATSRSARSVASALRAEGGDVEFIGVGDGLSLSEGTLVPCVVGEEDVVFERGVSLGAFEGFSCPGVNDLGSGFIRDEGQSGMSDSCFHMGGPLDKSRVVSMFFVEKREGIIDD